MIRICGGDGMAKYKLGDIAPIRQGIGPDEFPCWLLNLDMVESNTGRIIEYAGFPASAGMGCRTATGKEKAQTALH